MKKSKLLMPLTGIAAIGAIAPVAVMTSCGNKNEYKIVADAICGNLIDAHQKTMTNRLGTETLIDSTTEAPKTSIEVSIGATLTKKVSEIDRGHTIKRIVHLVGDKSETGTPFYIDAEQEKTVIDGTAYDEINWFTENAITLKINSTKMAQLLKDGKTEQFPFKVSYEEFDANGSSVGKQDWEYTIVACPSLSDLPTTGIGAIRGVAESQTSKNVTIYDFGMISAAALQDLTVSVSAPTEKLLSSDENELIINAASGKISEGNYTTDDYLKATLSSAISSTTTFTADTAKDAYISITLKTVDANASYVLDTWTITYTIEKSTGITVTVAA